MLNTGIFLLENIFALVFLVFSQFFIIFFAKYSNAVEKFVKRAGELCER